MNSDVAKCVEDRKELSGDDSALLKRISVAYIKASNDLLAHSEVFRPSNEWLPIYKHNLKEAIQALEECNTSDLDKIYRNFWREPCSTGLVGLPVDMKSSFFGKAQNISYVNKSLYLNDSIHRFNLWKKLLGQRFPIDSLISPVIGNPYGYFIDEKFIKSGADYQHYYATRINDLLNVKQGRKIVAEIGGGFGGMAYYLIRDAKNSTYIDFDLPENLALTTYYLLKAFPEKKVLLYGEAELDGMKLADYDIILMPSFQLDKLPDATCDLIFNSYSLAEMSAKTISHYVLRSSKLIKEGGWFFHVNHTKHSLVSARDFPIPDNFELISEEFAAWNLGRNSNMDEFEFLYKKK
jgi:putative sugar O-methyltransferase